MLIMKYQEAFTASTWTLSPGLNGFNLNDPKVCHDFAERCFIEKIILCFIILLSLTSGVHADPLSLPSTKDLSSMDMTAYSLTGPGLKGNLNFKAEKSEYLFSITINKSRQGLKYKLKLSDACSKGRAVASPESNFDIGSFKGIKQELLTEFFVNRSQIEDSAGTLKFKYFQVFEESGKKPTQVACVQIAS